MKCFVCPHETVGKSIYCARCGPLIINFADQAARAVALRDAYDPATDSFICFYTGERLITSDPKSPWYVTVDHRTPGKAGTQVVAAAWVNRMKSEMAEDEFRIAIPLLARCFDGEALDITQLTFRYWNKQVAEAVSQGPMSRALGPVYCPVCDKRADPYIYCPRCRRLIFSHPTDHRLLAQALKAAYDKGRDLFVCRYTHIPLDASDGRSPFFVNYDHRIPRKIGDIVVCAAFINAMKNSMSDTEFWAAVRELARHFAGAPFDRSAVRFRYWTKA